MNIKKMVNDTLVLAWLKSIPDLKRQPMLVVLLVGFAAIPLLFITMFGGEEMLDIGLVGVIVSSVGFIGISASIQDLTWDRYVKLKEMVVAMPVHPVSYAMGLTLASLAFTIPGIIAFTALGLYRGLFDIPSIITMFGSLTLCWLGLSVMGFTVATYLHKSSPNTLGVLANLLSLLFVFLPPVYYSEKMLVNVGGYDLSWIAYLLPTTNSAAIIRYSTGLTAWDANAFMLHWVALVMIVVVFTILVVTKARWREP